MGQTIAEMYIEQGKQQGGLAMAQETLLCLLRKRFKKLPRKVESRIAATTNVQDLKTRLVKILNAETLDDVGIPLA